MECIEKGFVFADNAPTDACHASTLVRYPNGELLCAWFGGTAEGHDDVRIYASRRHNGIWDTPRAITPAAGVPQWNPVLFQTEAGVTRLFYKQGKPIADWYTMTQITTDNGLTWSEPVELIEGDRSGGRGPVKNKPIRLQSGRIVAPASTERGVWRCHVDLSDDNGKSWKKVPIPIRADNDTGIIQPSLWENDQHILHALMRSNAGYIFRSESSDSGEHWTTACPTDLPNNNSGLDCVRCEDGRIALVCNPVCGNWGKRTPLSLFISEDGKQFSKVLDLEMDDGEYSYPAIISEQNTVYISYTWKRERIAYCVVRL